MWPSENNPWPGGKLSPRRDGIGKSYAWGRRRAGCSSGKAGRPRASWLRAFGHGRWGKCPHAVRPARTSWLSSGRDDKCGQGWGEYTSWLRGREEVRGENRRQPLFMSRQPTIPEALVLLLWIHNCRIVLYWSAYRAWQDLYSMVPIVLVSLDRLFGPYLCQALPASFPWHIMPTCRRGTGFRDNQWLLDPGKSEPNTWAYDHSYLSSALFHWFLTLL